MKEHVQKTGVRKYAGDDLIELQAEPLRVIQAFFEKCGNCVINGCEVVAAGNKYNVTPGVVSLSGTDADGAQAAKVVPFGGVENVTLPIYLTLTNTVSERVYGDGKVKPIAYNYTATATNVHPEEGITFLEITTTGGKQFVDAIKVTEKLDKVGNGKDVTVTFAEAAERVNITSGEKLSGMFSKVQKWFAGLKTVAFTGKAADLEQDANNRLVTDTEKTAWADKYTKAQTYTRTEVDNKDAAALQAAKEYAAAKVAEIVNSAPGTLDTLQELAKALGNDPNFATSITALIGGKADRVHGHAISEVSNLQNELNGKAAKNDPRLTDSRPEIKGTLKTINECIPTGDSSLCYNTCLETGSDGVNGGIISMNWQRGNFCTQIFVDVDSNYKMAIRNRNSVGGWNEWKNIWTEANFNPDNVAAVNHAHTVMAEENIFVGGSRDVYYPVVIPIREQGINRFVIRRGIHEDGTNVGSLRAVFEVNSSLWSNYVGLVRCTSLISSGNKFIAKCEEDSGANMKGCVVYLKGNLTYSIDYYYEPNAVADVCLVETNIGSGSYPTIVNPTTVVSPQFSKGNFYPVTSADLSSQLNLKADSDHDHGDIYAPKEHSHNYAASNHTHNYEPAFAKKGAFNKDFGTAAGTVAQGNHTHEGVMKLYSRCKVTGSSSGVISVTLAGVGTSNIIRLSQGCYKIVHYLYSPNYVVILNGTKATNNNPVFATISEQTSGSFVVTTADDNSPNDSIFEFTMLTY